MSPTRRRLGRALVFIGILSFGWPAQSAEEVRTGSDAAKLVAEDQILDVIKERDLTIMLVFAPDLTKPLPKWFDKTEFEDAILKQLPRAYPPAGTDFEAVAHELVNHDNSARHHKLLHKLNYTHLVQVSYSGTSKPLELNVHVNLVKLEAAEVTKQIPQMPSRYVGPDRKTEVQFVTLEVTRVSGAPAVHALENAPPPPPSSAPAYMLAGNICDLSRFFPAEETAAYLGLFTYPKKRHQVRINGTHTITTPCTGLIAPGAYTLELLFEGVPAAAQTVQASESKDEMVVLRVRQGG